MDAEFFCLPEDMEVVGQLVRDLGRLVDPTIGLQVQNAEAENHRERYRTGSRYIQLLHGSIPPERQLGIEINTSIALFGSRIYLRVYWPMLVQGYYWGPLGLSEGLYRTIDYRHFDRMHGLGLFLPALAIRGRMVLVPKGQNKELETMGPNEPPPPPPLERGVIEVDFRNPAEVEQAFIRIGEELRRELRQELAAYQSFHLSDEVDFDAVSAHLGVPPSLLRHAIREESGARELIYHQLRCTAEPAWVITDVQTRMSLRIHNPSKIDLGRLRVQVRGPRSGLEINPERVSVELPAGASVRADFSVVATRPGEFAIEVLFLDADADAARDMLPVQQLWITSLADG